MLKYVNYFAASKNLCTFASVKGTQNLFHKHRLYHNDAARAITSI